MRITKINIDSLYGIHHLELDGSSVEITGKKGTGKTSVIDAIKYALTNRSERPYIIKDGESAGEIFISTDIGTEVKRKKQTDKSDYLAVKNGGKSIGSAQSFLNDIFTPLQLNPIEFAAWSAKEQNRAILGLIQFDWDMNWIREQFGEIPSGVDYSQHILAVLDDIQSKNGDYWKRREAANREEYYKRQTIADMAAKFPPHYDVDYWAAYDVREKSSELQRRIKYNSEIERARAFYGNYQNKVRGIEAERDIAISAEESAMTAERISLEKSIERLKAEIREKETALGGLESSFMNKKELLESQCREKIAKLDGDIRIAEEYKDKQPLDVKELQIEIDEALKNKEFVSEYRSMIQMEKDRKELIAESERITEKIELARALPGMVLEQAEIPIKNLTIRDGQPLINGRPIANLSSGEKIDLCVDIALAQTDKLGLILLDGAEALDDDSRAELYRRCLAKGVQIIATRTTSDNELIITELE